MTKQIGIKNESIKINLNESKFTTDKFTVRSSKAKNCNPTRFEKNLHHGSWSKIWGATIALPSRIFLPIINPYPPTVKAKKVATINAT